MPPAAQQTEGQKAWSEMQRARADERKAIELELATAVREEKIANMEMDEISIAAKENDERLSGLRDRVAGITAELSQLKLNSSLAEELIRMNKEDLALQQDNDPNMQVVTFREMSTTLNTVFRKSIKTQLHDANFMGKLAERGNGAKPEYCRVVWTTAGEEESAEWKVHDARDGTYVNFGALLQDVCRYWGLDHADMCFIDAKGHTVTLEMMVWDELGPTGDVTVYLERLQATKLLDDMAYNYEIDESTLPLAVRRRLDRDRRAAQLERHTKETIRKAKERERAEKAGTDVFTELITELEKTGSLGVRGLDVTDSMGIMVTHKSALTELQVRPPPRLPAPAPPRRKVRNSRAIRHPPRLRGSSRAPARVPRRQTAPVRNCTSPSTPPYTAGRSPHSRAHKPPHRWHGVRASRPNLLVAR